MRLFYLCRELDNFQLVEESSKRKIPLETKGHTSILSIESRNCSTANAATLRSVKVATPLCAAKEAIPCGLAVSRLEVCVENNPPYDCRHTEDFLFYEHRTMRGFPSCRRAGAGCPFSPGILAEGRRGRGFHPWPPARSGRRRLGSRPRVHRRSGGSIRSSAPRAWAGAPQSCAP